MRNNGDGGETAKVAAEEGGALNTYTDPEFDLSVIVVFPSPNQRGVAV